MTRVAGLGGVAQQHSIQRWRRHSPTPERDKEVKGSYGSVVLGCSLRKHGVVWKHSVVWECTSTPTPAHLEWKTWGRRWLTLGRALKRGEQGEGPELMWMNGDARPHSYIPFCQYSWPHWWPVKLQSLCHTQWALPHYSLSLKSIEFHLNTLYTGTWAELISPY